MTRIVHSDYMHWAKTRAPVRYNLASSEVPHFRLDRFDISIADLELDGASRHRGGCHRYARPAHSGARYGRLAGGSQEGSSGEL